MDFSSLNRYAIYINQANREKGFWDNKYKDFAAEYAEFNGGNDLTALVSTMPERNVGELIALIHSELSEALEAHRKDLMDEHLPHRKGLEVELADALIRILDMAGGLNLDIGGAVEEKLEFNKGRAKLHGKNF